MKAAVQARKGDRLLTIKEACALSSRSPNYLRRLMAERRIAYVQDRPHAKVFIWESDLLAYFTSHERRALTAR